MFEQIKCPHCRRIAKIERHSKLNEVHVSCLKCGFHYYRSLARRLNSRIL